MAYIPVFKASRHGDILSNFVPENNMKHNIMNEKAIIMLVRNATLKINYAEHTILIDPVFADKGTLQSLSVYIRIRGYIS